jgi:hypothetical protein
MSHNDEWGNFKELSEFKTTNKYTVDWDTLRGFEDLILILKAIEFKLEITDDIVQFNSIKKFLTLNR